MTSIEERVVPLGAAQGSELLEVTLAGRTATVVLRCPNGELSQMVFHDVEIVTNRSADGMVVERLIEHLRLGGAVPSRFVFESRDGSRSLSISATPTIGPLRAQHEAAVQQSVEADGGTVRHRETSEQPSVGETPTLDALLTFARSRPTRRGGSELSEIGLILGDPEIEFVRGDETPVNSLIFAHTGGDSVHYCLVGIDGMVTEESPVVMVVPCNSDEPRLVLGESLREFLALGCVTGFELLEELVYHRPVALQYLFDYQAYLSHVYSSSAAQEEFAAHLQAQRVLLRDLSAFFGLTPWLDPGKRLQELQKRWLPRLRIEQS